MATLIYWQDPTTGALATIRLDAILSESPEDSLAITDHPVEQGANVVDHAREEPTRLSIEGLVSTIPNPAIDRDTGLQVMELSVPVRRSQGSQSIELNPPKPPITASVTGLVRAGIGALVGNTITGQFSAETRPGSETIRVQALQQNSPRNRVREVYEALLLAQSQRQLVTVNTRDRELPDMMLERVAKPRSVENGSSSQFQIDFKRIRIASSKTVSAPKPAETRGKGAVNKGAQATKPADAAGAAQLESTLSQITPG